MRLSIIIPAYNEERTLGSLLEKIKSVPIDPNRFQLEIIVVNDGSTDKTASLAAAVQGVRCITQMNQGKGAAVQRGVRDCNGDYLLVQDADLEYDPKDYAPMLKALPSIGEAVIYGCRIKHPKQTLGPRAANLFISLFILVLYWKWLEDPLTAYKLYPTHLVRDMHVRSSGFEADHEMTAKLIRRRIPIIEVPVRYTPRSVTEGKKIRAIDGLIALWTLLKYRVLPA